MAGQRVGSLEAARAEARGEGKLVLVYLWYHGCGGSATMGEYAYPALEVGGYIERHFSPVRFNTAGQPRMEAVLLPGWTPILPVEDAGGAEHRRGQGYLSKERFPGQMALARLQEALSRRDSESASGLAGEALRLAEGDAHQEPETTYRSAAALYKPGGDRKKLVEGWSRLPECFPGSEWAKRASYIRL